jgi:hypothetical protein
LESFELNVFPNPANNQITIAGHLAHEAQTELRIVDMRGKLVLVRNLVMASTGQVLDVSQLASGTYIVQVQSSERLLTTKLVIRR